MAEIVNLRLARKCAERARQDSAAAENRVRHGRTKSEKQQLKLEARRDAVRLDGHRLSAPAGDDPD